MPTEEGERYLFMAIDRTARFAHAELLPRAGKMAAARLLRNLVAAAPQTTHTVRADNGIQFTNRQGDCPACVHSFDRVCRAASRTV